VVNYGEQEIYDPYPMTGTAFADMDSVDDYNYTNIHVRVHDAMAKVYIDAESRRVEVTSIESSSTNIDIGDSITVDWSTEWAVRGATLRWWGAFGEGSESLVSDPDFSKDRSGTSSSITAQSTGTGYLQITAKGPGTNGLTTVYSDTVEVTIASPLGAPGAFTLNETDGCHETGGSDGYFDLSWSASANATSYEVYARAWSTGTWYLRDTVYPPTTSYRSYEAIDTDWYFYIKAKNSQGTTDSNVIWGGKCESPAAVTADIKANGSDGPITINYNTSATIAWSSANATSCSISPTGWSGTSGSQPTGNLTSAQTYTLTCSNSVGSVIDSVTVNVGVPPDAEPIGNLETALEATNCDIIGGWAFDPDTSSDSINGDSFSKPLSLSIISTNIPNSSSLMNGLTLIINSSDSVINNFRFLYCTSTGLILFIRKAISSWNDRPPHLAILSNTSILFMLPITNSNQL